VHVEDGPPSLLGVTSANEGGHKRATGLTGFQIDGGEIEVGGVVAVEEVRTPGERCVG